MFFPGTEPANPIRMCCTWMCAGISIAFESLAPAATGASFAGGAVESPLTVAPECSDLVQPSAGTRSSAVAAATHGRGMRWFGWLMDCLRCAETGASGRPEDQDRPPQDSRASLCGEGPGTGDGERAHDHARDLE